MRAHCALGNKGKRHTDRALSPGLLDALRTIYDEDDELYVDEAAALLERFAGRPLSLSSVARGIKELGLTRKSVCACTHMHAHACMRGRVACMRGGWHAGRTASPCTTRASTTGMPGGPPLLIAPRRSSRVPGRRTPPSRRGTSASCGASASASSCCFWTRARW